MGNELARFSILIFAAEDCSARSLERPWTRNLSPSTKNILQIERGMPKIVKSGLRWQGGSERMIENVVREGGKSRSCCRTAGFLRLTSCRWRPCTWVVRWLRGKMGINRYPVARGRIADAKGGGYIPRHKEFACHLFAINVLVGFPHIHGKKTNDRRREHHWYWMIVFECIWYLHIFTVCLNILVHTMWNVWHGFSLDLSVATGHWLGRGRTPDLSS